MNRTPAAMLLAFGLVAVLAGIGFILSANESPTPGSGLRVAQYDGDGFSFAYPEDWRVISGRQHFGLHGSTVMAAVGIGDFDLGCVTTPNSVTCPASPTWTIPNGGIVLAYRLSSRGGPMAPMVPRQPIPPLGPREMRVAVNGRVAVLTALNNSMSWHFPNTSEFIEARWDPAIADSARAQVEALVATWQWHGLTR